MSRIWDGPEFSDTMNSSRSGRVTQKQIADDLGISVMTVQRAIHGSGYVSDELRQRIYDYMKRTNYRPHRAARSLVKGTHYSIAVFSTDKPDSFWDDVERGITMVADEIRYFGFDVTYRRIPHDKTSSYLRSVSRAISEGVDAVALVNNSEFDMARVFERLDKASIPYVTLNIDAPQTDRICYVGPDYRREGRIVAHHLRQVMGDRGHIVVVTGILERPNPVVPGSEIEVERIAGVRDYCAEVGGYEDHELTWPADTSPEDIAEQIRSLVRELKDRPAGIYIPHIEPRDADRLFPALGETGPVVLSYFSSHTANLLESGLVSAVVYQDPVLQGYLATRILEHVVETGERPSRDSYIIHQSLINQENAGLVDNLFLIRELRL